MALQDKRWRLWQTKCATRELASAMWIKIVSHDVFYGGQVTTEWAFSLLDALSCCRHLRDKGKQTSPLVHFRLLVLIPGVDAKNMWPEMWRQFFYIAVQKRTDATLLQQENRRSISCFCYELHFSCSASLFRAIPVVNLAEPTGLSSS